MPTPAVSARAVHAPPDVAPEGAVDDAVVDLVQAMCDHVGASPAEGRVVASRIMSVATTRSHVKAIRSATDDVRAAGAQMHRVLHREKLRRDALRALFADAVGGTDQARIAASLEATLAASGGVAVEYAELERTFCCLGVPVSTESSLPFWTGVAAHDGAWVSEAALSALRATTKQTEDAPPLLVLIALDLALLREWMTALGVSTNSSVDAPCGSSADADVARANAIVRRGYEHLLAACKERLSAIDAAVLIPTCRAAHDLSGVLTVSSAALQRGLHSTFRLAVRDVRFSLDTAGAKLLRVQRDTVRPAAFLKEASDWHSLPTHVRKHALRLADPADRLLLVNTTRAMRMWWHRFASQGAEAARGRRLVATMSRLCGDGHRRDRWESWIAFVQLRRSWREQQSRRKVRTIPPRRYSTESAPPADHASVQVGGSTKRKAIVVEF